jgi:hypothetical protein
VEVLRTGGATQLEQLHAQLLGNGRRFFRLVILLSQTPISPFDELRLPFMRVPSLPWRNGNDHLFFHENIARKKKDKQKEDSFLLHRHDKHRRAHAFYVRRHKPMNAADREYLRVTCSRTMVEESSHS